MKKTLTLILAIATIIIAMTTFHSCITTQYQEFSPYGDYTERPAPFNIRADVDDVLAVFPNVTEPLVVPFQIVNTTEYFKTLELTEIKTPEGVTATCELEEDYLSGRVLIFCNEDMPEEDSAVEVSLTTYGKDIGNSGTSRTETLTIKLKKGWLSCKTGLITVGDKKHDRYINIKGNVDYFITVEQENDNFFTIDKMNVSVKDKDYSCRTITFNSNEDLSNREATIKIQEASMTLPAINIAVVQEGYDGTHYTDSLALVSIYHKMGLKNNEATGYPGGKMAWWLTDKPIGEWLGVNAHSVESRVISFNMSLKGENFEVTKLAEEFGNLKHLQNLEIYNGRDKIKLEGTLPESLANLNHLKYIIINGGTKLTGNLSEHPLGKNAKTIKTLELDGVFQGPVPEWYADIKQPEFAASGFSGKIPQKVCDNEFVKSVYSTNAGDTYQYWPIFNASFTPKYIDYATIGIAFCYHYAIWCDVDMPEGVIKTTNEFGEHYEWSSQEALENYLINIRGYTDLKENLCNLPVNGVLISWYNGHRRAVGLSPIINQNGIFW